MTVKDKSSYLKGLLILIGKDKSISENERSILMGISSILGFDPKFCRDAIDEILDNEYIIEDPPVFSSQEIARAFVKDGIRLAFSDKELHLYELNWINSVIEANKIEPGLGMKEFKLIKESPADSRMNRGVFEISNLM
jgi:hypothetical protein